MDENINSIEQMKEKLEEQGYKASDDLVKQIYLMFKAGKRETEEVVSGILSGKTGSGKTSLAERFAKAINAKEYFYQCNNSSGPESLLGDIDISEVLKNNADGAVKSGILIRALEQSHKEPVVIVLDEIDKSRCETDSFLLDFIQNGRLTTGTDTYERGEHPIYLFFTSNDKRELDDALLNRCRNVEVEMPSRELFLDILGISKDSNLSYLGWVYDKFKDSNNPFTIRKAKSYLQDLEELDEVYDITALSQYINTKEVIIKNLEDIEKANCMIENGDAGIELPMCSKEIHPGDGYRWEEYYNKCGLSHYSDQDAQDGGFANYQKIENVDQLSSYLEIFKDSEAWDAHAYSGNFVFDLSEEVASKIRWADMQNTDSNLAGCSNNVNFGLYCNNGIYYNITVMDGKAYVQLDDKNCTLEMFIQNENVEESEEGNEQGNDELGDDD